MASRGITIWRWPVRMTHWLVVFLVMVQFITAELLDGAMHWHVRAGYALLALVLFRVAWGLSGDRHARFGDFLAGPRRVVDYARQLLRMTPPRHAGHNPLGGWSVIGLLTLLLAQSVSGLFANDDVLTEGPLYAHAPEALSDAMLSWHHLGSKLLLLLVAVHVGAIVFYWWRCNETLLPAMLHGRKDVLPDAYAATPANGPRHGRAIVLLVLAAAAVAALVIVAEATAPLPDY